MARNFHISYVCIRLAWPLLTPPYLASPHLNLPFTLTVVGRGRFGNLRRPLAHPLWRIGCIASRKDVKCITRAARAQKKTFLKNTARYDRRNFSKNLLWVLKAKTGLRVSKNRFKSISFVQKKVEISTRGRIIKVSNHIFVFILTPIGLKDSKHRDSDWKSKAWNFMIMFLFSFEREIIQHKMVVKFGPRTFLLLLPPPKLFRTTRWKGGTVFKNWTSFPNCYVFRLAR